MYKRSELNFLLEVIVCQFLLIVYYRMFMFKPIFNLSYNASLNWFHGIIIFFTIGTGVFCADNKSLIDAFICTALPLEIYTVLIYLPYKNLGLFAVLICLFLVLLLYAILLFKQKIRNKDMIFDVISYRIRKYVNCSKFIASIFLLIIVAPVVYNTVNNIPMTKTHKISISSNDGSTILNDENMAMILKLEEDTWKTLSRDEKIEVLQKVADIEAVHFGIPLQMEVTVEKLDVNVRGKYNDAERKISIDTDVFNKESAHTVVEILCHEAYHGYERRLTELYRKLGENDQGLLIFKDVKAYDEEFKNYTTGEGYYEQKVEEHAREYSRLAINKYFGYIEEYYRSRAEDSDA